MESRTLVQPSSQLRLQTVQHLCRIFRLDLALCQFPLLPSHLLQQAAMRRQFRACFEAGRDSRVIKAGQGIRKKGVAVHGFRHWTEWWR